ncbi:uncharacterized protein FOMMEDRAFT_24217 [Fomitiporia mediterranea MF3/22]|uniref:Uncharacterized protein n=1 Tax=Fomitiporia mediterranea (strain MF3/22) TaxID=694068 RepID=R7SGE9_FOMME|nr:uncharacterized protein FOMMEDRAFT_24217 [Fomitiporia mediterranea MF3/22]EJC97763.1 hypothetical protein FOMMEDRAFT_24217 [Fomitiporia mediterranea MF3/22]
MYVCSGGKLWIRQIYTHRKKGEREARSQERYQVDLSSRLLIALPPCASSLQPFKTCQLARPVKRVIMMNDPALPHLPFPPTITGSVQLLVKDDGDDLHHLHEARSHLISKDRSFPRSAFLSLIITAHLVRFNAHMKETGR